MPNNFTPEGCENNLQPAGLLHRFDNSLVFPGIDKSAVNRFWSFQVSVYSRAGVRQGPTQGSLSKNR